MKYRLKDKARQEALEKALPGFQVRFQEECAKQNQDGYTFIRISSIHDSWIINIEKDDIDTFPENNNRPRA